jgi:hypothetical protein
MSLESLERLERLEEVGLVPSLVIPRSSTYPIKFPHWVSSSQEQPEQDPL